MEKAMTLDKLLARLNDPYRHQWTSAMIAATCDAAFAVIGEQAHKIDALAAEQGRPVLDDTTGELAAQHYWQHEFYRVEKMVEAEQDRVEELERENERLRKQAEAVAKELGLPQEALSIAGCDVLAHYVRDLRINYEREHGKLVDLFALCKMKGMEITMFECAPSPEPKP